MPLFEVDQLLYPFATLPFDKIHQLVTRYRQKFHTKMSYFSFILM